MRPTFNSVEFALCQDAHKDIVHYFGKFWTLPPKSLFLINFFDKPAISIAIPKGGGMTWFQHTSVVWNINSKDIYVWIIPLHLPFNRKNVKSFLLFKDAFVLSLVEVVLERSKVWEAESVKWLPKLLTYGQWTNLD